MEARDIKPGHRVTFTDNTVILMLASNPVVCDNAP